MAQIKAVVAELPTYGYRRVHATLKRQALAVGLKPANHKRVLPGDATGSKKTAAAAIAVEGRFPLKTAWWK